MTDEQFRPQAPSRPLWKLQDDNMAALKQTTDNNQPLLALVYAYRAIDNLVKRVELLEKDILGLLENKVSDKPTKVRPAKAEEVTTVP